MTDYWICSSYANLRSVPVVGDDPAQQCTQLLFAEKVRLLKREGSWAFVEALEQLQASSEGWHGYYGWLPWEHIRPVLRNVEDTLVVAALRAVLHTDGTPHTLLLGTRLCGFKPLKEGWTIMLPDGRSGWISAKEVTASRRSNWREPLLQLGLSFLGSPYFWGGRSPYLSDLSGTGIDCSGLVNLLYRVYGIDLPRDAHDQFLHCPPLSAAELKPGDLVFTAPFDRTRVDHVMLFFQGEILLETTKMAGLARTITFQEKLGVSRQALALGTSSPFCRVSFGQGSSI